jgi:hypothetical protein
MENYAHLQGLRVVPLAIPFLGSAAWRMGWLSWLPGIAGHGTRYWFAMSLAAALIASYPIRGWYRRRFGTVNQTLCGSGALGLTTFAVGFAALVAIQDWLGWAWPVPLMFVTVVMLYVGTRHAGLRRHYVVLALACMVFIAVGRLGMPQSTQRVLLELLIGFGLVFAGVRDHVTLRRVLYAGAAIRG